MEGGNRTEFTGKELRWGGNRTEFTGKGLRWEEVTGQSSRRGG